MNILAFVLLAPIAVLANALYFTLAVGPPRAGDAIAGVLLKYDVLRVLYPAVLPLVMVGSTCFAGAAAFGLL